MRVEAMNGLRDSPSPSPCRAEAAKAEKGGEAWPRRSPKGGSARGSLAKAGGRFLVSTMGNLPISWLAFALGGGHRTCVVLFLFSPLPPAKCFQNGTIRYEIYFCEGLQDSASTACNYGI